jgi:hypothetical protein
MRLPSEIDHDVAEPIDLRLGAGRVFLDDARRAPGAWTCDPTSSVSE